jgi:CheY-like chemotaxis protein
VDDDKRVLVVEDDALTRRCIVEVLLDAGYRVVEASNGAEALALLREQPLPALILLDLMMPVMTGQEFRAEQLQDPRLAAIPVVVVSAVDVGQAQELRIDEHLPKPFCIERLLASVSRYC